MEYNLKLKSFKIAEYLSLNKDFKSFENDRLIDKTSELLDESVERHLISDVEVGTFLSVV